MRTRPARKSILIRNRYREKREERREKREREREREREGRREKRDKLSQLKCILTW